jgi:DNA primase
MHDIYDLLNKKGIDYSTNPNNKSEVLIKCISGLHEDSNPSMRFNLDKNIFNCFSCGFGGSYKKLLKTLGEDNSVEIETKQTYKIRKLKDKLHAKYYKVEVQIPKDAINFNFDFKGVGSSTIKQFEAFTTTQYGMSEYICFPVYQAGRLRFIEGRYKILNVASSSPRYMRKPNNAKTSDLLYPLDRIKNKSHLILVEGLFDMLNLWQHGYTNTVCIFGTNNFKKEKVKILDDASCKRVTIFMDNDISGRKAAENIQSLLEAVDIETNVVFPYEGRDPGDMNKKELMKLFGEDYDS